MKRIGIYVGGFLITLSTIAWALRSQESFPIEKNRVSWAHEFLRAAYPELSGRKYALTVETYLAYDQPQSPTDWLRMDVGEGPRDEMLYISGGCRYTVTPSPPGWPRELGPPPPVRISPSPNSPQCTPGLVYPKQFLTAGFVFDKSGYLKSFSADGSFIDDHQAGNKLYDIFRAHPDMSDQEIVSALKQTGAKYGPDDKEQFIKDLPIKRFERFFGTLEIVSVGFTPLGPDRVEIGIWPDWTVTVWAKRSDGTTKKYEMHFNYLQGYLQTVESK